MQRTMIVYCCCRRLLQAGSRAVPGLAVCRAASDAESAWSHWQAVPIAVLWALQWYQDWHAQDTRWHVMLGFTDGHCKVSRRAFPAAVLQVLSLHAAVHARQSELWSRAPADAIAHCSFQALKGLGSSCTAAQHEVMWHELPNCMLRSLPYIRQH